MVLGLGENSVAPANAFPPSLPRSRGLACAVENASGVIPGDEIIGFVFQRDFHGPDCLIEPAELGQHRHYPKFCFAFGQIRRRQVESLLIFTWILVTASQLVAELAIGGV